MKNFTKIYLLTILVFVGIIYSTKVNYESKINQLNTEHEEQIASITEANDTKILELQTYEYLYNENKMDVEKLEYNYKALKKEYSNFKDNIAYMKKTVQISRGTSSDLMDFEPITTEDLNIWISAKAPPDSPFIGNAESFIKASNETGMDPKYIVAHAALESGWGKSYISKSKNNYFGIGSFNTSPLKSSYTFDSMTDGIISGAKWIYTNYVDQGQDTLEKMIYGKKAYCVNNNGKPDPNWIIQISSIMSN